MSAQNAKVYALKYISIGITSRILRFFKTNLLASSRGSLPSSSQNTLVRSNLSVFTAYNVMIENINPKFTIIYLILGYVSLFKDVAIC